MVIKKTINKEAIKEMPKVLFPGQIHLVQTPWEAEKAVTYLKPVSYTHLYNQTFYFFCFHHSIYNLTIYNLRLKKLIVYHP